MVLLTMLSKFLNQTSIETDDPLTTFNKYRSTSRVRLAPSTIDKTLNPRMGRPFS